MMRISNAAARFTTSRPMLPSPMTPRVLARSSVPMNLRFSHLPDLMDALALGIERARRQHEREGVLSHGNRVAARSIHHQDARGGGGGQIDVIDAHARAADDAQIRRGRQHGFIHCDGAADDECVGPGQMLHVLFRDWKR